MWSDAAREASAAARAAAGKVGAEYQHVSQAAHQTKVYEALHKDRFTGMVPPGSTRDFLVKQAARWAESGLEKAAYVGIGGGPVGLAGLTLAQYTRSGGEMARRFGPALKAKYNAWRARHGG